MKHCTYITVHETTGLYYIGKGITANVLSGRYKGSGKKLKAAFKEHPKTEWKTSVLWEFETAGEAYSDEAGLLTDEHKDNPLCLNICYEGKGGWVNVSEEQYKAMSAKRRATLGVEGRKALRQAQLQSMSPEDRKAQARKAVATLGPEGCSERTRRANASQTREQKLARLAKQRETMGPEKLHEMAVQRATKTNAKLGPEGRKLRGQKAADTRAAKRAAGHVYENVGGPQPARRKPCTVDGITIYERVVDLIKALGRGKNGYHHPNFRYI